MPHWAEQTGNTGRAAMAGDTTENLKENHGVDAKQNALTVVVYRPH